MCVILIDNSQNPIAYLDGYDIDVGRITQNYGLTYEPPLPPDDRVISFYLDGTFIDDDDNESDNVYRIGPNGDIRDLFEGLTAGTHEVRVDVQPEGLECIVTFEVINAPTSSPTSFPSITAQPTELLERIVLIDKDKNSIAPLNDLILDVSSINEDYGLTFKPPLPPDDRTISFFLDGTFIDDDNNDDDNVYRIGPNGSIEDLFRNLASGTHEVKVYVQPEGLQYIATFEVVNAPTSSPTAMPTVTMQPTNTPTDSPSPGPSTTMAPTELLERIVLIDKDKNSIAPLHDFIMDVSSITQDYGLTFKPPLTPDDRVISFYLDGTLLDDDDNDSQDDNVYRIGPDGNIRDLFEALTAGTHEVRVDVQPEGLQYTATFEVVNAPTSSPTSFPTITAQPTKTIEGLMLIDKDKDPIKLLDGATLDLAVLGVDLGVLALVADKDGRSVSFHFDTAHIDSDDNHEFRMGPSGDVQDVFANAGDGTHQVRAFVFPDNIAFTATFEIINTPPPGRRRKLQSGLPSTDSLLLTSVLQNKFTGASGFVEFGREYENGRNSEGITVGIYNVRPNPVNPVTGRRSYEAALASSWGESSGWDEVPGTGLIYRDGSPISSGVIRRVFSHNYISFNVRVIGLSLMGFAWVLALMSIVLIGWLREDPIIQRAQPFFMQTMCLGAIITSAAIFTLSWDEDAGWTNHQLSVACSLTPWFFFTGHILIFCSLFVKLWRVDRVLHFKRAALSVADASWALVAFFAVTFSILLAQSVYDPWSWERHIIKEIPAETYGKCQSSHDMAFFGSLIGILFIAEGTTFYFAWKTADLPTDFRDSEAITHACLAQLQAWAVGVPMLGAVGISSANATYFARIFLTWIFSVSSVALIVCPKLSQALKIRRNPESTKRKGRVSVSGVCEPSSKFADYSSHAPSTVPG